MKRFAILNLGVLAYNNGFTLWHYKAPSLAIDTLTPDYFADAADMLSPGDIMFISAPEGSLQVFVSRTGLSTVEVKVMARTE